MEYRILGPLEVLEDGRQLPLKGSKQRALLAVLLLHANEAVSRDRLVDELWGDDPPETAATAIHVHVSQLRKVLGRAAIETRPRGYAVVAADGVLDANRFDALVRAAPEGTPAETAAVLREALALWRGPALGDIDEAVARAERARLEEKRLQALEQRIEADLALGAASKLVAELEALVAEHPLRERFRAQLMLALYRSGRQADALAAYREGHRLLNRELGLEPGEELRALERAILEHDPAIGGPPPRFSRALVDAVDRRRRALVVVGAAVVVLAAILALVARPWDTGTVVGTDDQVVALDHSGDVDRVIGITGTPSALAAEGSWLWVAEPGSSRLQRIDIRSGEANDQILLPSPPGSVAAAAGDVWVTSTTGGTLVRVNPQTGRVFRPVRLGSAGPAVIASGPSGLWATDATDRALVRIDPRTGRPVRRVPLGFTPGALAVDRSLWVSDYEAGTIHEIDPLRGAELGFAHVGNGPVAVVVGAGALWVANSLDGTVSRVDAETRAVVATYAVGDGPSAIALADGSAWVANRYSGTIARIPTDGNGVAQRIAVGSHPAALAVADDRLWVGAGASGAGHRGGTLVLSTTDSGRWWSYKADPALYDFALPAQFTGLAYDTLVTYQHVDGPAGLQLVPDLAVAIPTASDGGRSYAFRIRRDIRYSDGRVVRASDFRRAFVRLWSGASPGSPPAGVARFMDIVGMDRCASVPWECDLSQGIVTDDATGTVVFRLRAPDPDFLPSLTSFAFSAPIPPGTPDPAAGEIVPGTGPYRMVVRNEHEIRFARNPFYREWSAAAQPDGYPDEIVWRLGAPSHGAVVRAIEHGQADWTFDLIPPAQLAALQLRTARVHVNPWYLFQYIALNPHAAPFDDVRVRQALNLAIDRRKIVGMYGGSEVADPSCQPLVPGLPGFERYCPYTVRPSASGVWKAPDLDRARRLVAASGASGQHVDVFETNELAIPSELPAYVAGVLRALGFRVQLHRPTDDIANERQIMVHGDWIPDWPQPSSYMQAFLSCHGPSNVYSACDPGIDRRMELATSLQNTNPGRAAELWAEVDHEITNRAWWVPTVTPLGVDLVSSRVGNYRFHPLWGFMADQAWVQ